jgi:hypothetical protein
MLNNQSVSLDLDMHTDFDWYGLDAEWIGYGH